MEDESLRLGLKDRVILTGLKAPSEVASHLQAADVFALSSAYEGMPMCVAEALGCGLPVVSTDVGEVRRVVNPGVNGEIAAEHSPTAFGSVLRRCIEARGRYMGNPCTEAAAPYVPEHVLQPVYQNYRRLAARQ